MLGAPPHHQAPYSPRPHEHAETERKAAGYSYTIILNNLPITFCPAGGYGGVLGAIYMINEIGIGK